MRREIKSPQLRPRLVPFRYTSGSATASNTFNIEGCSFAAESGNIQYTTNLNKPFSREGIVIASPDADVTSGGRVVSRYDTTDKGVASFGALESLDDSDTPAAATVYGLGFGWDSPRTDAFGTTAQRGGAQTVGCDFANSRLMIFQVDASAAALTMGGFDASITDNGTGDFTLTFNEPFGGDDVIAVAQSNSLANSRPHIVSVSRSAVRVEIANQAGSAVDTDFYVLVWGQDGSSRPSRRAPLLGTQKDLRMFGFTLTGNGTASLDCPSDIATITDNGTGDYTVTWGHAFQQAPAVFCLADGAVVADVVPQVASVTTTSAQIRGVNPSSSSLTDSLFQVLVIGSDYSDSFGG